MTEPRYLNDIKGKFPGTEAVLPEKIKDGIPAFDCPPSLILDIVKYLKAEGFNYLMNLCATDYKDTFEVIYHLSALESKAKITLKVKINREKPELASITPLHPGANWQEREAFDLLGVVFTGHPNLTRILLSCDWEGYPLRKDYSRKPDQYD